MKPGGLGWQEASESADKEEPCMSDEEILLQTSVTRRQTALLVKDIKLSDEYTEAQCSKATDNAPQD